MSGISPGIGIMQIQLELGTGIVRFDLLSQCDVVRRGLDCSLGGCCSSCWD